MFEPLNRIRRITGAQPRSGPRITAIVNAASLTSGALAPGELVSIFGANLGPVSPMTAAPKNNQVLPVLGNVLVYIGGVTAPIAAISEKREPNSSIAQVLPCMRTLGRLEKIIDPERRAVAEYLGENA